MWNWDLIDLAAESLGVKPEARKKWRQRKSVPHRWRLPLMNKTKGKLTVFEKGGDEEVQQV